MDGPFVALQTVNFYRDTIETVPEVIAPDRLTACDGEPAARLASVPLAARIARPESFAMVMATGIVATGLRQDRWPDASDALVVIAAAAWLAAIAATLARLARSPAGLRADAVAPGRGFAWYAVVAACVVLGSCLARVGGPGVPAAAALAGVAVAAWLTVTGLVPARIARRAARPDLQSVTGTLYLWPVATQSVAIAAAVLAADGELPAEPGVIVAIVAWSAGVLLYLVTLILVATRLVLAGPGPAGTRAAYWVTMGAAAISVLAAALIVRAPDTAAGHTAAPVVKDIGVVLWSAGSAFYLVLAVVTALWWARTRSRPGYQPSIWVIVFPVGMYAVASWQLGAATGLTFIHRVGIIAVWPAALAWAMTSAALVVSAAQSARRAVSGRVRSGPPPLGSHPDHPAAKRRYTFEALVTIAPGASPSVPVPGPDWRGIIRAGTDGDSTSPGLFSALVAGWDPHSSDQAGARQALATIVAFGPQPAECLPVGGSFSLWRGRDVGHGIVTRRIFV
jgi:tellurite resistance protein TehA-like permease